MTRRQSESGQTIIFLVLALPMLFGMFGLAFDIGYFEYRQRRVQTAADAAALAGAINLTYGTATAAARAGSAANGFTNGTNSTVVTVNNPPAIGPHAGGSCSGGSPSMNCNYVEVIVSQPQPTFFLGMIGITTKTTVAARAVATSTQGDCVFALEPSATGLTFEPLSLNIINAPNCAMIIDSTSSSAVAGFLTFSSITTSQTSVVGGVSCFFCSFTPAAVTGATPLADPLAYLTAPAVAACAGTVKTISTGTQTVNPSAGCYKVNITGSANVTFMPGEYSSIVVSAAFAPTLTFQPGLYIIQGVGGLSLTGVGATLQGNGVTFYIGPSAGSVAVNGVANFINLLAPTTGTWAGILFFQDRSNAAPACVGGCGASLSGILNFAQIQGALYFPDAALSFEGCCQNVLGNAYYTGYEITVAKSLTFAWDIFNDDYSSLPGGSPIKKTLLVE